MIIIVGVAGAGKSVQGRLLADMLHCKWLSVGNVLRTHITDERREHMLAGELIDDQEIFTILEHELEHIGYEHEVVLDGFPRSISQAEWLIEKAKSGQVNISAVVHLEIEHHVAKERLLLRGRLDDNEDTIQARLRDFNETILPILDLFKTNGFSVKDVNGLGTIAEVHERINGIF